MKKLNQVILIDDSKAVNAMNKSLIDKMDIAEELLTFESANEAFSTIIEQNKKGILPEIIFLDLEMPDVNGFKFLDMLIDHFSGKDIGNEVTIVFLSDHLQFENFSKTKQYKSFVNIDHLRKPMDEEDITNLLEEHYQ